MRKMFGMKNCSNNMSCVMGMIAGIGIGVVSMMTVQQRLRSKNSFKNKAKKAFKTIEESISM